MNARLDTVCHKITGSDGYGVATLYLHVARDAAGRVAEVTLTPKTRSGTAFEDLLRSASDVLNEELAAAPRPTTGER